MTLHVGNLSYKYAHSMLTLRIAIIGRYSCTHTMTMWCAHANPVIASASGMGNIAECKMCLWMQRFLYHNEIRGHWCVVVIRWCGWLASAFTQHFA
jgi:hypothetical protein